MSTTTRKDGLFASYHLCVIPYSRIFYVYKQSRCPGLTCVSVRCFVLISKEISVQTPCTERRYLYPHLLVGWIIRHGGMTSPLFSLPYLFTIKSHTTHNTPKSLSLESFCTNSEIGQLWRVAAAPVGGGMTAARPRVGDCSVLNLPSKGNMSLVW